MLFGRRKHTINRILIVEDEPLVAFDNEHFLREIGYDVVATVDTVEEAVRVIDANGLDLVLADVRLSDGNGIDVARAAHDKGTPVLFVTGNCPMEARALAVGCLSKPYQQRDLRDAIEAVAALIKGNTAERIPTGLTLF
jgi:DNA-binding response OmpR family regulator